MYKLIGISLLLLVLNSMVFATGQKDKTIEDGKTVLSIYVADQREDYPVEGTKIGNYLEEETNVHPKFEFLVGEVETKTGILLASGEYPDLINARGEEEKFVDAGAFIPLEDLIVKHAPNLYEIYKPYWNLMKRADGHIYNLSDVVPVSEKKYYTRAGGGFLIQKAVLEEAGWPLITTLEQYTDIIENYANNHPEINGKDTIGFLPLTHSWRKWFFYSTPTNLSGHPNDGAALVDKDASGRWVVRSYFDSEETFKTLKVYNEWYLKGLLDPSGFVEDFDQYLAKLASGRVLGVFDYFWEIQKAQEILKAEIPERMYVAMPVAFEGVEEEYQAPDPFRAHNGFAITTSCKNPVTAIKYLDYIAQERIQKLLRWGYESVDHRIDENGRYLQTSEQAANLENQKYSQQLGTYYFEFFPKWDGVYRDGNSTHPPSQPEVFFDTLNDYEKEVLAAYNVETFGEMFNPPNLERLAYYPLWSMKLEPGSEVQLIGQKADDLREKFIPLLILAEKNTFEDVWSEYKVALEKLDIDKLMATYQEKVDKRVEQYNMK